MTQNWLEYISQLSEEIERRVTKKLSKEFSRTESRILGALSKLDDFLLNPQVRTCSVAVLGTSRNSNSENREPTGDRSLDDPCPEVRYPSHHSGNLNSPEVEDYPHRSNLQSCCFISVQRWKHSLQTKRVIGEAISFSTELLEALLVFLRADLFFLGVPTAVLAGLVPEFQLTLILYMFQQNCDGIFSQDS